MNLLGARRRPESLHEAILGALLQFRLGDLENPTTSEDNMFFELRVALFVHVVVLPGGAAGTYVNFGKSGNRLSFIVDSASAHFSHNMRKTRTRAKKKQDSSLKNYQKTKQARQ